MHKENGIEQDNGKGLVGLRDGELRLSVKDLEILGIGFNWSFLRTYISHIDYVGPLGKNWILNYDRKLVTSKNGTVTIFDGYGGSYKYVYTKSHFVPQNSIYSDLSRNLDGTYIEKDRYGTKVLYSKPDKSGRSFMLELRDRNENTMAFEYDKKGQLRKIKDTLGRPILYNYNEYGTISEVIDFVHRKIILEYKSNLLKSVKILTGKSERSDSRMKLYKYQSDLTNSGDDLLVSVVNPNEAESNLQPWLKVQYLKTPSPNNLSKVSQLTIGGVSDNGDISEGNIYYEYYTQLSKDNNIFTRKTRVKDRNGNLSEYYFDQDGMLALIRNITNRRIRPTDPPFYDTKFRYNKLGELISVEKPEGNSSHFTYDENNSDHLQRGNLLKIKYIPDAKRGGEQETIEISYRYEPIFNSLASVTNSNGNTITYIYDYQEGDSLSALASKSMKTEREIRKLLDVSNISVGLGDVNNDNRAGQINGNVVKVIYPSVTIGIETQKITGPNYSQEVFETLEYDDNGQIRNFKNVEGYTTYFDYYPVNKAAKKNEVNTSAGSYLRSIRYNSGSDPKPEVCVISRPVKISFDYDLVGNLLKATDGRGVSTLYEYNGFDELVSRSKAAKVQTKFKNEHMRDFDYKEFYSYDRNGNIIRLERELKDSNDPASAKALAMLRRYNILGKLIETVIEKRKENEHDVITKYRYDNNQNLVLETSPLANLPIGMQERQVRNVKSYVYDERDFIYSFSRGGITEQFSKLECTKSIAEIKELCGQFASALIYYYDRNGNLVETIDAVHAGTELTRRNKILLYDGYDRNISMVDSLGNQTYSTLRSDGKIANFSVFGSTDNARGNPNLEQPLSSKSFNQPLLKHMEFNYDELDRLIEERSKVFTNDSHAKREYNEIHASSSDRWYVKRYEYDRLGRIIIDIDNEKMKRKAYTSDNYLCFERDAEGNEIHYTYDENNNLIMIKEIEVTSKEDVALGLVPDIQEIFVTIYVYDSLNRLVRSTDNIGNTYRYKYDSEGNCIFISDALSSNEPRDLVRDPLLLFPTAGQDTRGASKINLDGNSAEYYYDNMNRLVSETIHLRKGGLGKNQIDTDNEANSDGLIVVDYKWDANNRITAIADDGTLPNSGNTSIGLIEEGNTLGNVTRYSYDEKNRLIKLTYPDGSSWNYTYGAPNTYDELNTITDPNGSISNFTYGPEGVLQFRSIQPAKTTLEHPAGSFRDRSTNWEVVGTLLQIYNFDWEGRVTSLVDSDFPDGSNGTEVKYYYDSLGRLTEEVQNGEAVQMIYDDAGRKGLLTYPSGRVLEYQYDRLDRVKSIRESGISDPIVQYNYIGPGRILRRKFGNQTTLSHLDRNDKIIGYDGIKRPIIHQHVRSDNATIESIAYKYDRTSNRISETTEFGNRSVNYSYDSYYRFVSKKEDNLAADTWQLDGVGNWYKRGNSYNGVNELNQYTSFRGLRLLYDMNGNLIDDGKNIYRYDALDRLRQVIRRSDNVTIAKYGYDVLNRRRKKVVTGSQGTEVTTTFTYAGWAKLEEKSGGINKQLVHGRFIDEIVSMTMVPEFLTYSPGVNSNYFFHDDANTNIVCITDDAGKVVERYSYDSYGVPTIKNQFNIPKAIAESVNLNLFTGKEYDPETGLYYYCNRYYSPTMGRFISRDAGDILQDSHNRGNPYTYVNNNPRNYLDPLGYEACRPPNCGNCPCPPPPPEPCDEVCKAEFRIQYPCCDPNPPETHVITEKRTPVTREPDYGYPQTPTATPSGGGGNQPGHRQGRGAGRRIGRPGQPQNPSLTQKCMTYAKIKMNDSINNANATYNTSSAFTSALEKGWEGVKYGAEFSVGLPFAIATSKEIGDVSKNAALLGLVITGAEAAVGFVSKHPYVVAGIIGAAGIGFAVYGAFEPKRKRDEAIETAKELYRIEMDTCAQQVGGVN